MTPLYVDFDAPAPVERNYARLLPDDHVVRALYLDCDVWSSPEGGGQRLTADPASASSQSLQLPASWAAAPVAR